MILERVITYLQEYCDGYLENQRVYKLLSPKDSRIIQDLSNALSEMSEFTPPNAQIIWDELKEDKETT